MSEHPKPPQVIVLGDVITDILVFQRETLNQGSDTRSRIEICAGGSAANLATWLATAGLTVHFIGRAGRDPFGAFHQEELRKFGVIPHLRLDEQRATGTIVVLVEPDSKERHMLTDRGANENLSLEDIPWQLFSPGHCFHLSGYSLQEEAGRKVARQALAIARREKMTISVDPSSTALLNEIGPERFLEWTGGADWCFPNLEEGRLLSGQSDPQSITTFLTEWYGEVILKLGAQGAIWASKGQPHLVRPALAVEAVDSTGAGDAFCAGFLASRLRGASPEEALAAGMRSGAKAVAKPGARPRYPDKEHR